ncbi:hypothetical protein [Simplicispira psychrophila]|uniref:hypothetical protein n=1 Tax=Simplicispira psychrophila TaxID=80882 RepID=UPI00068C1C86|nr:hypothetical protein [Simplicispira psychrophila]
MKFSCIYRALQASALASAALLMLPAGAQTTTPDMPAATAAPAAQSAPATHRMHKQRHRAERHNARHNAPMRHHNQRGSGVEPANANRLASDSGATTTDYQRNALARCDVFKMPEDHKACMERMRQVPDGSVQGGGLLWEYSYEVPANGS